MRCPHREEGEGRDSLSPGAAGKEGEVGISSGRKGVAFLFLPFSPSTSAAASPPPLLAHQYARVPTDFYSKGIRALAANESFITFLFWIPFHVCFNEWIARGTSTRGHGAAHERE